MEDTIAEGFRGHRQLTYAHWITFLIHRAVTVRPLEMLAEYSGATAKFPAYNLTQMLCHSAVRTPSQPRQRGRGIEYDRLRGSDISRGSLFITFGFLCVIHYSTFMFTFMHWTIYAWSWYLCDSDINVIFMWYVTCVLCTWIIYMSCHLVMLIFFASVLYSDSNELYFVYSAYFISCEYIVLAWVI